MSTATIESYQGQRVVYASKDAFVAKLNRFRAAGPSKLSVVSDFDFTISNFFMSGVRGASCHKVIEDCGLLAKEYHNEAQGLQAKYYPLEVDPTLNMEEKTKYMIEWVEKAHELLEQYGLTKSVVTNAVKIALQGGKVGLREKTDAFFALAASAKIPSLIFSAGIADVLEEILRTTTDIDWSQVHVISNRCIFEQTGDGKVVGFEQPLLHVFNKKSTAYLHTNFFKTADIKDRTHLLLLGDSLGDITMSEGMQIEDDNIIKVGFLNDRVERLDQYLEKYDIVILDDPGFDIPLHIVSEIVAISNALSPV